MPSSPHLELRCQHRIGMLSLNIAFRDQRPLGPSLFGPSGSGKSTVLRILRRPSNDPAPAGSPSQGKAAAGHRNQSLDPHPPPAPVPLERPENPSLYPLPLDGTEPWPSGLKNPSEVEEAIKSLPPSKDLIPKRPHELSGGRGPSASP